MMDVMTSLREQALQMQRLEKASNATQVSKLQVSWQVRGSPHLCKLTSITVSRSREFKRPFK